MYESLRQWIVLVVAVVFIAGSAQITIDLDWHDLHIPVSGQSFAVLVTGMLLGRIWGFVTIVLYLILGGLGLPFFADGTSGWETFVKGSGGFLIGFGFSTLVMGWLADLDWGAHFIKALLAMTIGTILILSFGLMWLTYLYGWRKALEYGLYPFVLGAVVKIVLGATAVWFWNTRMHSVYKSPSRG